MRRTSVQLFTGANPVARFAGPVASQIKREESTESTEP